MFDENEIQLLKDNLSDIEFFSMNEINSNICNYTKMENINISSVKFMQIIS